MNLFISIQTLHGFTWSWWLLCWLSFLSSDYLSLLVHQHYSLSIWEFNFHPYCYTYTSHPPYAPAWLLPQLQPERLILNPPSYLYCVTECRYWPRQILTFYFLGISLHQKPITIYFLPTCHYLGSPCLFQCSSSQIFFYFIYWHLHWCLPYHHFVPLTHSQNWSKFNKTLSLLNKGWKNLLFSFPTSEFPATTLLHSQLHPIFFNTCFLKGVLSFLSDPSFSWLKPCYYPLLFTSESPHSGPFTAQLSLPTYPPLFEVLLVSARVRTRILIFVSLQSFVHLSICYLDKIEGRCH